MTEETQSQLSQDQQQPQTRAIAKTQFQDEDWALVGVPSENALKALKAFCLGLVGTPFLPKSLVKDQTPDQQAGTMLAVCLTGREMGFSAMQSLRNFWLSPDGRLGMYSEGLFALMLKNDALFEWLQLDNQGAKLKTTRGKNVYISEFTIEDAQRAGLAGKAVWKSFPRAMCKSRVGGDTFRTLFADLGGAQTYTKEELIDMEEESPGAYRSVREQAEEAADKKAESDPNLEVVVGPASAKRGRGKPKETPVVEASAEEEGAPKINLPTGTTVEATPEFIEKFNELSPQEARNAAFLANQSKKEAPKPASTVTATPIGSAGGIKPGDVIPSGDPEKAAIRARMEAIRKAISPGYDLASVSQMIHAFYGDAGAKSTKQILIALDNIESALANEKVRSAFISICKENPVAAGKNLRTALDALPIFDKDEEPAKAEPSTATGDFIPGLNWGDDTVRFAREVMTKRKIDETKLVNVMRTYDVHEMPEGQASIWLLLYWFNSDSMLLAKRAKSKGKTAADVLDLIEAELKSQLTKESNPLAVERAITNAFTELSD